MMDLKYGINKICLLTGRVFSSDKNGRKKLAKISNDLFNYPSKKISPSVGMWDKFIRVVCQCSLTGEVGKRNGVIKLHDLG
ncbi:hypothetical protein BBR01nite_46160 [Brevibacillus brevis]|nr:hypothetical protein BBR01nite_46160 [Brevibacillus brevis]